MTARPKIAGFIMGLALACASACGVLAADAAPAPPKTPAPAAGPVYREFTLGKPSAKVTVIEYASLTCPHCAHFEQDDYPILKKDYIDTGKIKYVYRDYPLDGLAAAAALIARCVPGDKGLGFIETLFINQLKWVQAPNPAVVIKEYATAAGMTDDQFDACLKNQAMLDSIRQIHETAMTLYHVEATPTFLVGEEKIDGADYAKLKATIDKQLETKTK